MISLEQTSFLKIMKLMQMLQKLKNKEFYNRKV